jgi:hypothetical protein
MAIKPKQILDTAVGLGHEAVKSGVKLAERLRKDESDARATSGSPTTVGAPKPGKPGGPKTATAPKAKPKPAAATSKRTPTKAKPKPKAAAKPKAKARSN